MDPVHGDDATAGTNDPDHPFKKLQTAIDEVQADLVSLYNTHYAGMNPPPGADFPGEGIAFALPGVYGTVTTGINGPNSSGDTLPITLRDRVHVRGLGSRRCILRGSGANPPNEVDIAWPVTQTGRTSVLGEVLLDLSFVNFANAFWFDPQTQSFEHVPWFDENQPNKDLSEVFQGFTFQGGDCQVMAQNGQVRATEPRAVVANCVFDMRHNLQVSSGGPQLPGPYFGVLLWKTFFFSNDGDGYVDQRILIANNTFVLAEYGTIGWAAESRPEAVAVIDVSDAICTVNPSDCDHEVRGLGNAGLINNLIRTRPDVAHYAMLGIDESDTLVSDEGNPPTFLQTNAFAAARVGNFNGFFWSRPRDTAIVSPFVAGSHPDLWDCGGFSSRTSGAETCGNCVVNPTHTCSTVPVPVPTVAIYDGPGTGVDPAFVGEYLASIGVVGYEDWRLLPSSNPVDQPLKDSGFAPSGGLVTMANGTVFDLPNLSDPFLNDMEDYGNPRQVDGAIDIGADEIHFLVMAGSWGNESQSHNQSGFLNPDAPAGTQTRFLLIRETAGGVSVPTMGYQMLVHGQLATPATPPPAPSGWVQQPGTQFPVTFKASLPRDYNAKYIKFNDPSAPPSMPWTRSLGPASVKTFFPQQLATGQAIRFVRADPSEVDDECSGGPCEHGYFNLQGLIKNDDPTPKVVIRSNLQGEYR